MADYPYAAVDQTCAAEAGGVAQLATHHQVLPFSESQLKAAIAQQVVSVTLDAEEVVFGNYTGGVVTSNECGDVMDHAVTAVGYGTDPDFGDYYLVRNSWGTDWGLEGHIKIGRNGQGRGLCGIQQESVYPVAA